MAQLFAYANTMSCRVSKARAQGETAELEPIDGRASDFEQGGDVAVSCPGRQGFAGVFSLLGREFGLASEFYPLAFAAFTPARVRSVIRLRSSSAILR